MITSCKSLRRVLRTEEIHRGASQLKQFFYLISTSKYESHSQVLPENALEPYQQQEHQKKRKGV